MKEKFGRVLISFDLRRERFVIVVDTSPYTYASETNEPNRKLFEGDFYRLTAICFEGIGNNWLMTYETGVLTIERIVHVNDD